MPSSSPVKVCVVLPALNEGKVIGSVLKTIPTRIKVGKKTVSFKILVVDDGSTDDTFKKASSVKRAKVIQHLINMGAGAATRTGLHYARDNNFDLAVTMDADGQHVSRDLVILIKTMLKSDADLLIGGRLASNGNMPLSKKVGNRILSYITFLIFGVYVSDSQSGFRVFSRKALEHLNFNSNNYAFCSEMLWQAKRAQLKVSECPIQAVYTKYSIVKGQKKYSGALEILQQMLVHRIMDIIT